MQTQPTKTQVQYITCLQEVHDLIKAQKKVAAIVLVRNTLNIPLLDARTLVDMMVTLNHYSLARRINNED